MTSTVTGESRPGLGLGDLFGGLFPCGSITGAPKIRTMALITELEDRPRGVYCGAVGVVFPGGAAAFNVAIRTLVVDQADGRARYDVGGGAVSYTHLDVYKRQVIHPPEHEHLTGVVLLDDGCHEALVVALEQGGDGRVEGAGAKGHGCHSARSAGAVAAASHGGGAMEMCIRDRGRLHKAAHPHANTGGRGLGDRHKDGCQRTVTLPFAAARKTNTK